MKKLPSLLLAALLLLSLPACGQGPAPDSSAPTQGDSPVTTEAEVRALYAGEEDAEILSVEAYQGDFLVTLGGGFNTGTTYLDWVYGESGIRRRMLWLDEPIISCKILEPAAVYVVSGGPNAMNRGVPEFPTLKYASLNLLYDEQGRETDYNYYTDPFTYETRTYWAGTGESYGMGMEGQRVAIRSAQLDAGGLTVAFAPLADGSGFADAYCKIPYTEVGLSENGLTLTVTLHDTFLDSGELGEDVDVDFLQEYGSLYPESFPAGELSGECRLVKRAELHQDGSDAVLTVTLDEGPIHSQTSWDGYYRFTAMSDCTGLSDIGPYLRVQLNASNEPLGS